LTLQNQGYETLLGKGLWMLDNDPSCHLTSNLNLTNEIRDVVPVGVELPNGKKFVASKKGTVILGTTMKLSNVLYAPDLH